MVLIEFTKVLTRIVGPRNAVIGPTIDTVHFLHVRNEGIDVPCIDVRRWQDVFRFGNRQTSTDRRSTIRKQLKFVIDVNFILIIILTYGSRMVSLRTQAKPSNNESSLKVKWSMSTGQTSMNIYKTTYSEFSTMYSTSSSSRGAHTWHNDCGVVSTTGPFCQFCPTKKKKGPPNGSKSALNKRANVETDGMRTNFS